MELYGCENCGATFETPGRDWKDDRICPECEAFDVWPNLDEMERRLHGDPTCGASLISQERMRQKRVEGWTAEHDAQWIDGELIKAAICYALAAVGKQSQAPSFYWPWATEWYKPHFDDSDLVRAGALIAAELDRRAKGNL